MTRWNVNTIAVFNATIVTTNYDATEGPLSSWTQYKRIEIYIGGSAKWWRRKEKEEIEENEQFLALFLRN